MGHTGPSAVQTRSLDSIGVAAVFGLCCLLFGLFGCAAIGEDAREGDVDQVQWYVREVTKGEVVPEDGPHQHFEVSGQATPIQVGQGRFALTYDLPDGRRRRVVFLVDDVSGSVMEVTCPLANLEPNADALSWEDRRLNEAISDHVSVRVATHEWTTFFNDRLSGVFSSDWQLWWGELTPE